MSTKDVQTEAATTSVSDGAEEQDVKIPVEAAGDQPDRKQTDTAARGVAGPAADAAAPEGAPIDISQDADDAMTEDEMIEAAIRAGEEAADNDFKFKYERCRNEVAQVREELDDARAKQDAAEHEAAEANDRATRLQADWENFRRRTAAERLSERSRATEKLITALLPVLDDMERAVDHARAQKMGDAGEQLAAGVAAVHAKLLDVLAHEGVEPIDPKGRPFDPLEQQAVGRVENHDEYDETVADVYQKGYRIGEHSLRPAMVTVTYGGRKRPAPELEAAGDSDRENAGSDEATAGA